MGLEAMTGFLLKVLGDVVHQTARDREGAMWFQFRQDPSPDLKTNMHRYLKDYNNEHKTKFSVSFPKPFRMQLREGRRSKRGTARPGSTDPGSPPDRPR
jgi:hypothetical protein